MNEKKDIADYFNKNDDIFIQLIDKFEDNFSKIPDFIKYYYTPYFSILYSDYGNFYIKTNYKYDIKDIINFLNSKIEEIVSLYSYTPIVDKINSTLLLKPRNKIDYYLMKLTKKDFKEYILDLDSLDLEKKDIICRKAKIKDFEKLKSLQKAYHFEEVYNDGSFYPYEAEMQNFRNSLSERLNYAIFYKNKPVSKCAVNSESLNSFQIGGVFTIKKFRNKGLSKFCLSNLLKEALRIKKNILLYVKVNNFAAISVYKSLGFKIINKTSVSYY